MFKRHADPLRPAPRLTRRERRAIARNCVGLRRCAIPQTGPRLFAITQGSRTTPP